MKKILLDDDGMWVLKEGDQYYLRFDDGHFSIHMRDIEITPEEANRVLKNPDEAEAIIDAWQDEMRRKYFEGLKKGKKQENVE